MARVKISDLVNQNKILEEKIKKVQVALGLTIFFVAVLGYQAFFAI